MTLCAYLGALAWLKTGIKNVIEDRAQGPIGPFRFSVNCWNELIGKYSDLNLIPEDIVDWTDQAEIATALSADYTTELTELFERLGRQVGKDLQRPNSADLYIADLLGLDAAKAIFKAGQAQTTNEPLEDIYKDEDNTKEFVKKLLEQHGDTFLADGEPKTIEQALGDLSAKFDEAYTVLRPQIDAIRKALNAGSHLTTLGQLSRKYEARGPGDVSGGAGDPGGVSYGSYQMSTKRGTVEKFVNEAGFPWPDRFQGLTPGDRAFTAAWEKLATDEPEAFFAAQHAFIKKTHFDRLVVKIEADSELDVTQRSGALQDVVWSTAVQHGADTGVVGAAINTEEVGGPASLLADMRRDRDLIAAIYDERGRDDNGGGLVHFRSSSREVQDGVRDRFVKEKAEALAMFDAEFA